MPMSQQKKVDFNKDPSILKPLKAIIHGPPASGKTEVAKRVCRRYGAHYISVKAMIDDTLNELRENIEEAKTQIAIGGEVKKKKKKSIAEDEEEAVEGEEQAVEEEEEEVEGEDQAEDLKYQIEQWEEQIRDITRLMDMDENNKLPDDYVVRLMRSFLAKEFIQSHGYVLDGFPKTMEQTKEIFGQIAEIEYGGEDVVSDKYGEGAARENEGEGGEGFIKLGKLTTGNASINIMPDFIISLQADDEYIFRRIMMLPERVIRGTHYDESNMIRRMKEFLVNNTPDATMLKFFDRPEIELVLVDVPTIVAEETNNEKLIQYLFELFGPPIPGLGLGAEDDAELARLEMEEKQLKEQAEIIERTLADADARILYENNMEKWAETMEKMYREEEKILAAESEPLRSYLIKYVFPTLTKGLSEVAHLKPDDPIDYLAEYLFRMNPEGKMFDPAYTTEGEELLKETETILNINNTNNN